MKKIGKILGGLCLMLSVVFCDSTVKAFDVEKINFSNYDISTPWFIYNGVIDIKVNKDLKANNQSINYQFISITEAQLNSFMASIDLAENTFDSCKEEAELAFDYKAIREQLEADGEDVYSNELYQTTYNNYVNAYNACVDTYNSDLAAAYEPIPTYDDSKWKEIQISEEDESYTIYNINEPTDTEYYVLWIKAKDENNEDIYAVMYKESSSYVEPETPDNSETQLPEDSEKDDADESQDSTETEKDDANESQDSTESEKTDTSDQSEETKEPEISETPNVPETIEPEDNVETTVENPNTGKYISLGLVMVSVIGIVVYTVSKKKNYFSKI